MVKSCLKSSEVRLKLENFSNNSQNYLFLMPLSGKNSKVCFIKLQKFSVNILKYPT